MTGEFTAACTGYYRLEERLAAREQRFQQLLAAALPYTGQTLLSELDAIIACNREVQQALADVEETQAQLRETQCLILKMMRYFEIPPNTRLIGEIPGELEFELWADEQDNIHCRKTRHLQPDGNTTIIRIPVCMDRYPR